MNYHLWNVSVNVNNKYYANCTLFIKNINSSTEMYNSHNAIYTCIYFYIKVHNSVIVISWITICVLPLQWAIISKLIAYKLKWYLQLIFYLLIYRFACLIFVRYTYRDIKKTWCIIVGHVYKIWYDDLTKRPIIWPKSSRSLHNKKWELIIFLIKTKNDLWLVTPC